MSFNLEKFMNDIKGEILTLCYAKKQELLSVAQRCDLEVDPKYVKAVIIDKILQFFIDEGIFEDDDEDIDELRSLTGAYATPGIDPKIEQLRLQLQLQKEQQKMAALELQKQQQLLALEYEHKCKLAELEIQKEQKSANIQIKLKTDEEIPSKFDILKAKKLLPDFDEKDPEVFFTTFEDTAKTLKWPQEQWVMVVRNQFKAYCSYCKQEGHHIENCPNPSCKKSDVGKNSPNPNRKDNKKTFHVAAQELDGDVFKPFTCKGTVNGIPVTCLRDTGSSQSVVALPSQDFKLRHEYVTVSDLSTTKSMPLAEVNLQCPYYQGNVLIAVSRDPLPCSSIQLLIGNDLAGAIVNPVVSDPDILIENESNKLNNAVIQMTSIKPIVIDSGNRVEKTLDLINMTKSNFKDLQNKDPVLKDLWKKVAEPDDHPKTPYFYLDNDLLFRHFRSSKAPATTTWFDCHQLVLPLSLVPALLELAHSHVNHFGVNKTYSTLAEDFFWPGMKKDIQQFIKACHHCQTTGKPNERLPPAPLQPISVPKFPFERIIIDCVGPMPRTKQGNEYLLTVLCPTTRYPIAVPIKNINAKTIIGQLVKIFTTYGFPKTLQCDRGTNFTSKLFQQAMREFNIHNIYASAYHPQSNGALERVHQTIKNLLRKYMQETSEQWDRDIDLLMYIIRSVPQESTGVSPFELMFGRKPRTTLSMVKENLIHNKEEEITNILSYLQELKDKIISLHVFANTNLLHSQEKMSRLYDKKAKLRVFQPGDEVLVYHPIPGSPLREKFMGPYKVLQRISKVNYVLSTPDRRRSKQLVHVNLLKAYQAPIQMVSHLSISPEEKILPLEESSSELLVVLPDDDQLINWKDNTNSQILKSLPSYFTGIPSSQKKLLSQLLSRFHEVCSDSLQRSQTIQHDIVIESGVTPIHQTYYRMVGKKLDSLKQEVQYLLDNDLAEPSTSPWASPCLLVPKPNNQLRLCTDYRKLNKVTVKDSFPLPRINDILDSIGNKKILTRIDLMKGYYQVPLTQSAKEISSFITPFGLFSYKVMPFGLTNAPATFQRMMSEVIRNMKDTYVYLDDVVVASDDWDEHLQTLEELFHRFRSSRLTVNLAKSAFGRAKVTYLGHTIGGGSIMPKDVNIASILDYPIPTNKKELKSFLGMTSYYSRFIKNYSEITASLYNLTSPKISFYWEEKHQQLFNNLKRVFISKPILKAPNFNQDFLLQVDASNSGYGAVLLQMSSACKSGDEPPLDYLFPVSYFSGSFKGSQIRWATIEKELFCHHSCSSSLCSIFRMQPQGHRLYRSSTFNLPG
ncbi:uncharacterized protein [Palaemon carinicauda]|uniref:uncharacterized protein isoform X1 n=1 Tax=Palaemon carinicauda TaxID=392227 RepID=UPI0035B681E0